LAAKVPAKKLATLNKQIEAAVELREIIEQRKAELRPFEAKLDELEGLIRDAMLEAGSEAIKTPLGTYSLRRSTKPHVIDWGAVNKYVIAKKATDLYQARLHVAAWNDRVAAGEKIPGIETVDLVSVQWRKAS